ncbi:type IV pilin [Haloarcula salinisoli]|uniref:Type IV pilin N-terminal domain-containing protein n=1 Tax=Haloarcula salinisoli TaxID=2487746 RepID=A0A8J7YKG5_9EURY|nr:type IV pilin N-terminal domain-containing protein [Halomicroarcula salinisoli]MBX0302843.1 type IV pilin N-terminal domain-containing protein [Halomicroarcula salinisoli]
MAVSTLRSADDAVSPVVGVVLLFAISITLAAVTAGVVVGAEEGLISSAPTASFEFNYDADATGSADLNHSGNSGALTLSHVGGDTMDASNLEVRAQPGGTAGESALGWSGEVAAGSSVTVTVDAGATVRLVHSTDGSSTTVATWDADSA